MSLPSNFPGEKSYNIVVGGDINDPDQLQLSLAKVYDPLRHNFQTVSPENLPHIGTERAADHITQCQFNPPPEQGTVVTCNRDRGSPSSTVITGMINQINSQQNVEGNSGLYDLFKIVSQISTQKRIKPEIVEKTKNDVRVREAEEKGQDWTHNLTTNIADHAAWHPIAGQVLKEVQNIDTAIQNFAEIPGIGSLSQLPGQIMNLASLFKNMSNSQKKRATQNMSPGLINGLDNMITLMGSSPNDGIGYVTSDRINPEVFTENMIDLLSQVTNISDLIDTLHRLQTDKTLRGLEEYSAKTNSGLTATVIENLDETNDVVFDKTDLLLSDIVDNSRIHFDEGYSLNINSKTYLVVSAELASNTITVFPKIDGMFDDLPVYVYEPIMKYTTEGPYGQMDMTMDINGNIKPTKDSSQQIQQALQAIAGLFNSAEAGGKNLFGDMSGIMGQLFNRIPNNIRASILSEVSNVAKVKLDPFAKKMKNGNPFNI